MPFVLDASIAACWAFPNEQDSRAGAAIARVWIEDAVVPSLWWFEVRNILAVNERRKQITETGTTAFFANLPGCGFGWIGNLRRAVLRLARAHRLSVYDASYLELALREAIPMATLDGKLAAAAIAEGSELIGATP
jgi:predicted nucleic acid-binding protein